MPSGVRLSFQKNTCISLDTPGLCDLQDVLIRMKDSVVGALKPDFFEKTTDNADLCATLLRLLVECFFAPLLHASVPGPVYSRSQA